MRIRKYTLFILVLFIFGINDIKAEECDNNHILQLKELAENIDYNYEYKDDIVFPQIYKVSFNNIDDRLYIEYSIGIDEKKIITSGKNSIDVDSGTNKFKVYSTKCPIVLKTIQIELLKFNEFSTRDVCDDYKDELDVCDKWYQGDITEEKFNQIISEYEEEKTSKESSLMDKIIDYVFSYKYYFISAAILFVIVLFIFIYIKRKKSYLT